MKEYDHHPDEELLNPSDASRLKTVNIGPRPDHKENAPTTRFRVWLTRSGFAIP